MAVDLISLTCSPDGRAAIVGAGERWVGPIAEVAARAEQVERARAERGQQIRWVWWSAAQDAAPLCEAGLPVTRCWDVAEVHRIIAGGWEASPQTAWSRA